MLLWQILCLEQNPRIKVLRLHFWSKFLLTGREYLNHSLSDGVTFTLQMRKQLHNATVKCAID